jgi:hypothetical protein
LEVTGQNQGVNNYKTSIILLGSIKEGIFRTQKSILYILTGFTLFPYQTDRAIKCIITNKHTAYKTNANMSYVIYDVSKSNDVRKINSTLNVVQHILINSFFFLLNM